MGLLRISFAGAVLILAIVVVRAMAINRLPKKTFLALWIIAFIRLLLPFSVPSPFSIYSLVSRNVSGAEISDAVTYEYLQPVFEAVLEEPQNIPAVNESQILPTSLSVSIRTVIWIIGMLALSVSFLISYLRCRKEFKTALPINNDMITEWLSEHPLKRKIEIRQFSGILTPMTYGLFHPVILLPKNTDWENKQQLRYILFHEYVHICRYDTALKALAAIVLCIHWFNPMVWVLYIMFNRDIELACDECVIRRFGVGNRSAYARMLISMEEKKNLFAPFCNNFSKNAIEERIKSIMKMKKASVITLALACIAVVGTVGVFATSMQTNEPVFGEAIIRQPPGKSIMYYTFDGMTSESATEYAARNYPEIDGGYGQSSRAAALVNTVDVEIASALTGYLDERYSEYFIHANTVQNTKEKSVFSFSGDAVPIDGGERKIVNFTLTIDWNKVIQNNGDDFIEITTKMPYPDLKSPLCVHDLTTYTEPEIKTGRYYLNGDVNSYYFELTDDTLELCGVDLSELFDSWQPWGSNYAEGVSEELAQSRAKGKADWINEWTGKRPYKVKTLHAMDDQTILALKEVTTQDDFVLSSGIVVKDEVTLTAFGKDGDFILVE